MLLWVLFFYAHPRYYNVSGLPSQEGRPDRWKFPCSPRSLGERERQIQKERRIGKQSEREGGEIQTNRQADRTTERGRDMHGVREREGKRETQRERQRKRGSEMKIQREREVDGEGERQRQRQSEAG